MNLCVLTPTLTRGGNGSTPEVQSPLGGARARTGEAQ
jgi:hypothetical protein